MRCWVCESINTARWKPGVIDRPLKSTDLRITDDRYGSTLDLWRCHDCRFIFAVGRNLDELPRLYEELADPGYFESRDSRALQMRSLVQTILKEHSQARTLLDVGAGAGLLVAEARRRGLDAVGVEPSRPMVEHARELGGISLIQGRLPHPLLSNRLFDVITIVDVIEHVTNPVELLRDCGSALNPHGRLVVVTPDVGSLAARLMGKRWWHFRLAHVGYFNRRSLQQATSRAGLLTIRTFRPKWFFRIRYVAERLAQYVPIHRLNRVAKQFELLRRMYDRVIPLNIHDSVGLVLRRREDQP
jgi:2-polyprenyl-3-methyl-5-hydroxy-6-metoxy-1,4-benzoquinol methylase